jgi:transcriptional regulator with XRE-family HTH domain
VDDSPANTAQPLYQVGRRLRELRVERGLSQRELARRADMTNANLSMIEQGRVSPSIQTLEKILRAVPISLADFFRHDAPIEASVSKRSEQPHILHEGLEAFVCLAPRVAGPSAFVVYQHIKSGFALTEIPVASKASWLSAVVVCGTLSFTLGENCWTLACGDAVQFHQHRRFRLENLTDHDATLILVISSIDKDLDNKV